MNRDVLLHGVRRHYAFGELDEATLHRDAIAFFERWLEEALANRSLYEANAMALATASPRGAPSVRMVLLKSFDRRGFVFFTNYESRKGKELAANARASLLFWWDRMERQVRIEGKIERLPAAASDAYFAKRPRQSQLAAATSPQSRVVKSRESLLARLAALAERCGEGPVPRPAKWGGYRLLPSVLEFWQGRADRLHDRIRYTKTARGWKRARLAP